MIGAYFCVGIFKARIVVFTSPPKDPKIAYAPLTGTLLYTRQKSILKKTGINLKGHFSSFVEGFDKCFINQVQPFT